jgi:hypothetical protein
MRQKSHVKKIRLITNNVALERKTRVVLGWPKEVENVWSILGG